MQQYAETRRTALLERAAELDEYIQALQSIYKRSGQDGSGDALGLLSGYPEHLRQRCEKQQQDSAEDWEQAGHGYTTFTKELNEVSALVTLLFDSPENSNVPRMLLDAVQDACRRLELPQNGSVNLIWPHDDGLIWPRESEVSRGGPGVGDRGPGRVDPRHVR